MGQIILTEAILESLRTPNGGYDRRTLSLLGVGWPPYKKWKKKLVGTKIDSAILSVAKQSSIRPSEPYESSVIPPARFDYPTHDSHFEIQSFIYSSLKAYFDIRGQVVSGWREFDLIIFNSNFPIMIIDIVKPSEVPVNNLFGGYQKMPKRIIHNMEEAKELVEELMMKKLGLD